jgi:hypothetical protein
MIHTKYATCPILGISIIVQVFQLLFPMSCCLYVLDHCCEHKTSSDTTVIELTDVFGSYFFCSWISPVKGHFPPSKETHSNDYRRTEAPTFSLIIYSAFPFSLCSWCYQTSRPKNWDLHHNPSTDYLDSVHWWAQVRWPILFKHNQRQSRTKTEPTAATASKRVWKFLKLL